MDAEMASVLGEEIEKAMAMQPSHHLSVGQLETHIKSAKASTMFMNGWLSFIYYTNHMGVRI
jgi:hypothetical protein